MVAVAVAVAVALQATQAAGRAGKRKRERLIFKLMDFVRDPLMYAYYSWVNNVLLINVRHVTTA